MTTDIADSELERELGLNCPIPYTPCAPSWQYGANFLVQDYCRVRHEVPFVPIRWIHGWMTTAHQIDHRLFTSPEAEHPRHIFVAREDEKRYLNSSGFQNVHAVGLPFNYAEVAKISRRPRSLLVMPVHSLSDTRHQWKFDEYADEIEGIARNFVEVVICVHPSCFQKGYWAPHFKRRGFRVIRGVDATDKFALVRLKTLLSQFEYVTTNGFGSHIAYAASMGCKTSVFGTFPVNEPEDFVSHSFCKQNPGLMDKICEAVTEDKLKSLFPQLFLDPNHASTNVEWGRHQLGTNCRPTPRMMQRLMGWTFNNYARFAMRNFFARLYGS